MSGAIVSLFACQSFLVFCPLQFHLEPADTYNILRSKCENLLMRIIILFQALDLGIWNVCNYFRDVIIPKRGVYIQYYQEQACSVTRHSSWFSFSFFFFDQVMEAQNHNVKIRSQDLSFSNHIFVRFLAMFLRIKITSLGLAFWCSLPQEFECTGESIG